MLPLFLTKVWYRELGHFNIRLNAVAPGFTATEILNSMPEKILKAMKDRTPLGRLGQPREIANAYLFLASDEAQLHHRGCAESGRENGRRHVDLRVSAQQTCVWEWGLLAF